MMNRTWRNSDIAGKLQLIKRVWEAGMSAKQIAAAISTLTNTKVTRNAVIGIYTRHGEALKAQHLNMVRRSPCCTSQQARQANQSIKQAKTPARQGGFNVLATPEATKANPVSLQQCAGIERQAFRGFGAVRMQMGNKQC